MSSQSTSTTYTFKGDIWRLMPDEATGYIAVEVRDTASLQVYFCLLNPQSPALLLDHYQLPELWWTGLAGFNDQVLYLHGFEQKGQLGHPKGITAVDIATKKILFNLRSGQWEGQGLGYILVSQEGSQPKDITKVSALSGEMIVTLTQSELAPLQESREKPSRFSVQYPENYEEGSAYFQDLAAFLLKNRGHVARGVIDYLELDSCFILSYYVGQGNGLFMKFLVTYSLNGEALNVYHPLKDAERIGGPPFFVQADRLFIVQDRNVLLSVSLPMIVNLIKK